MGLGFSLKVLGFQEAIEIARYFLTIESSGEITTVSFCLLALTIPGKCKEQRLRIPDSVKLCREKKGSDEDRLRGKLLAKDGASRRIAASSLGRFLNSVPSPEKPLFSNLVMAIGRTLHSIP
ncbi:hypothetical protein VNO77_27494 [Canavalia gladiata]|uniref:Uncharacterized protein n=1 Tax=Canavalia gladiata TaxID=3824 RepID=A0AAN9Q477_CANGL